jgi:hypothetical protein
MCAVTDVTDRESSLPSQLLNTHRFIASVPLIIQIALFRTPFSSRKLLKSRFRLIFGFAGNVQRDVQLQNYISSVLPL